MRRGVAYATTRREGVVLAPLVALHAVLVLWFLVPGWGMAGPLGLAVAISLAGVPLILAPRGLRRWAALLLGLGVLFAGFRLYWHLFL